MEKILEHQSKQGRLLKLRFTKYNFIKYGSRLLLFILWLLATIFYATHDFSIRDAGFIIFIYMFSALYMGMGVGLCISWLARKAFLN